MTGKILELFTTKGCGQCLLLRVHFTVFYFRASHGLVRHMSQVLITMTSVTPFPVHALTARPWATLNSTWQEACTNIRALRRTWICAWKRGGKTAGDTLSSSLQTSTRNSSRRTSSSSLLLLTRCFCVCLIRVLMECFGGWTHCERMQSWCPCVRRPGRGTFLCVISVFPGSSISDWTQASEKQQLCLLCCIKF